MKHLRAKKLAVLMAGTVSLSACSVLPKLGPDYTTPQSPLAGQWQLPSSTSSPSSTPPLAEAHGGSLSDLQQWWQQFDDPLLAELIATAEQESPTLAQAKARIAQSRALAVTAGSADLPGLELTASNIHSEASMGGPLIRQRSRQVAFSSSWEIDLFGGVARQQEAANATLAADNARWHAARVSVAAETALAYFTYRFCQQRLAIASQDTVSRAETARLSGVLGSSGFQSSDSVALVKASAAQAQAALTDVRLQCDGQRKALVALTSFGEADLVSKLAAMQGKQPVPRQFSIDQVPASVLSQRPDVAAAERDLAAASASIGQTKAARFPKLQLVGSITPLRMDFGGNMVSGTAWSFGPSLSFPILDGGRGAANVDAAEAAYDAAAATYRQKVRDGVKEVEQALLQLDAAASRKTDLQHSAAGYQEHFKATETRYRAGLASSMALEEARRSALSADQAVAAWQLEQLTAWVTLYRAVGGGWHAASASKASPAVLAATLAATSATQP